MKGHIIQNWKFRSYVVNDFSADREDHLNRDAQLRYYKPQNAQNFHKERHETDQKTIKLRTIAFELGDSTNIAKCGTVYPQTAFALNVIFEDEGGTKLMYELVFNAKCEAEEFIRGMCSGARFTRGVKVFATYNVYVLFYSPDTKLFRIPACTTHARIDRTF